MSNIERPPESMPALLLMADRAMRRELVVSTLAGRSDRWPQQPSEDLAVLAGADDRFRNWPDDFARSHRLRHIMPGYYGDYWRVNSGMLLFDLDVALPLKEEIATNGLIEMILLTRLQAEPTGSTLHPYAPMWPAIEAEQQALHQELGGDPYDLHHLRGVTWDGVISALVTGQVRVGLAATAV